MKRHLFAAAAVVLAGAASAQTIHSPTTRRDPAEVQQERVPEPAAANRAEAQGGPNSQQNRDYAKETEPEGKKLNDGQPAARKQ